jgi:RNA polymerase sigma-70 factor (ECF subfamily)
MSADSARATRAAPMPVGIDDDREDLPAVSSLADHRLVAALRRGDEDTFTDVVQRLSPTMLRVASSYVRTPEIAQEVVQDAWLAAIQGLDRFEQRSSLKTWLLRIVVNKAKTRGIRERRTVPFSALASDDPGTPSATVDPDRFRGPDDRFPRHWSQPPEAWPDVESTVLRSELRQTVESIVATLPPRQAAVLTLRDIQGWSSGDVCEILEITPENQRVLLHRARAAVRRELELYLGRQP